MKSPPYSESLCRPLNRLTVTRPAPGFLLAFIALALSLLSLGVRAGEIATEGAEVGKWTMDFEAASALAKEKDLPLLLNFTGSDWCGWCKLMDGNVFAKPEWEEFASDQVILVTVDFPRDKSIVPEKFIAQNNELKGKFGIRGYPTYVVLDSDSETKIGQLGAGREKTPASFIEEVEGVLRFRQAVIDAKVEALGEPKGAEYLASIEAFREAEAELKEWIATRPERNEENNKKFADFQAKIEEARKAMNDF